jgi:hypothetical protein
MMLVSDLSAVERLAYRHLDPLVRYFVRVPDIVHTHH